MTSIHHMPAAVLVTGATGLVGTAVIERLVAQNPTLRVFALVRPDAAAMLVARFCTAGGRVTPVIGDVTLPGLGMELGMRARLAGRVRAVVHAAADTSFSRPLPVARAVNTAGTGHLLDLTAGWALDRFVHVSTAYVAGSRTGVVTEADLTGDAGFVNGYEQSKYEAEKLVLSSGVPHVIVRPSSIVCDDTAGTVTQHNAVHRALRVLHAGYGALMPGAEDTPVDMVTTAHVADGIVRLGFAADTANGTYHLCAGHGAIALGELLDTAVSVWSRDPVWRRRGILRPALADLATYRLFEQSVEETGDARLLSITRSLTHFVPQLAHEKVFDTSRADAALGRAAPVASFWTALVEHLARTRWGGVRSAA
jgi:thioester reductase-like protein